MVVGSAILLTQACGEPDPYTNDAAFQRATRSVERCIVDAGFTTDDVLERALNEPAFRRALDGCADDAGIRTATVLDGLRRVNVASGERVEAVARCMERLGRPMQIERFPDGSAVYGDLDRYFTPDTMDEFFDDFATCNEEPRDRFPTEAQMQRAREAKDRG